MIRFCIVFLFSVSILIIPSGAYAATLFFSPAKGAYEVGDVVSVSVFLGSSNEAVNAASGLISFSKDTLEVTSVSKNQSIFSLWVQEPSFSNTAGTVNVEGVIPNPGFTGASGKLVTINFRAKSAGSASLSFSSGAVLANDGEGTDVLSGMQTAQFSITQPSTSLEEKKVEGEPKEGLSHNGSISNLISKTHPSEDGWYKEKNVHFSWVNPDGTVAVRLLIDKAPKTTPSVVYETPISERDVTDLDDGIWYFHVQAKISSGWGPTAHYRVQIDTESPLFKDMSVLPRTDATDPRARLSIVAEDAVSGITSYEIQIPGKEVLSWKDEDGSHIFEMPPLIPGEYDIKVSALDAAGNSESKTTSLTIVPLEPPQIVEYPERLPRGDMLYVSGISYPQSTVTLVLAQNRTLVREWSVPTDMQGRFVYSGTEDIEKGTYVLSAKVVDARGAESVVNLEQGVSLEVVGQSFVRIGTVAITVLSLVVPLVGMILLLALIVWYFWYKYVALKRHMRAEIKEAESVVRKAFALLREDIVEHIDTLNAAKEKRKLTKEERNLIKQLRKDLDEAESIIGKEIEDIEKE